MKGDLKPVSPSVVAHSLQVCCGLDSMRWPFFGCKFKCRFLATFRGQQEKKPVFLVPPSAGATRWQYNQQGKIICGWNDLTLVQTLH